MHRNNYYTLLHLLKLVKYFYDIGVYKKVFGSINEISEDDYFEFVELGLEEVAPIYDRDQIIEGENGKIIYSSDVEIEELDDHWHELRTFSSPDMQEYYRLCRLYEYQQGIEPETNPFVKRADSYYSGCISCTEGDFFAGFDDYRYSTKLWIEFCPESYGPALDLIYCIHDTLEYYSNHLNELRRVLLKGPFVFLPQLPAPEGVMQNADDL